eukprot:1262053-Pleurochrysis_carterae.AAC.1
MPHIKADATAPLPAKSHAIDGAECAVRRDAEHVGKHVHVTQPRYLGLRNGTGLVKAAQQ